MYTRKLFNISLMAAMALAISMGVVSCKDDDDKELTPEQKEEKAIEQMEVTNKYWAVVGRLAGSDAYTEEWQDKTFAPIIGQAENGNEAVRVIMTGDIETAAMRFANLCDITIGDATPGGQTFTPASHTFTFHDDAIGTLTWHKGGATELATVDVDIKQMPGLSKLVYRTPDQAGENGDFKGTAYYRFGDVVSKVEDGQTDYWVCVRPAFGPEGKEDSHWISVSPLHGNYIKEVNKKGVKHYLPTNLCTDKEHIKNLAELLYVMINPLEYDDNLRQDYKQLGYFNDFHYAKTYDLNSDGFFSDVATYWSEKHLWELVFGMQRGAIDAEMNNFGLNFIYDAGSVNSRGNVILKQMNYSGPNNSEGVKTEMIVNEDGNAFDIRTAYDAQKRCIMLKYSDENPRLCPNFLVRYKTGKELCKGTQEAANYDKRQKLTNCTDVYVYNREAGLDMNNLRNIEPQKSGNIFRSHYCVGDVYQDENGDRWTVVNMAGGYIERSDYSELVCFEGHETTRSGSHVLDLPTRDQAIRATTFLWNMFTSSITTQTIEALANNNMMNASVYNMLIGAGVDCRRLFQATTPEDGRERHQTEQACIAYAGGAQYDDTQHLLRFFCNHQNDREDPVLNIWDCYPQNPSPTEQFPNQFTSRHIVLQDINKLWYVSNYSEDHYARRPIMTVCGGDGVSMREPRSETDERAEDVTNYFYNRVMWDTFNYPLSMWNEPVLVFRYAAVFDRGENNHKTKTTDGKHTLRLVQSRNWNANEIDSQKMMMQFVLPMMKTVLSEFYINGQKTPWPVWQQAIQ